MKKISIVVPIYNEERNAPLLFDALKKVTGGGPVLSYNWEFVFVNDGSTDGSAEALAAIATTDPRVVIVEFTRNFGKEAATSAGLRAASGDAAVLMDADFHHPPEVIVQLIQAWESGGEIVMGVRRSNGERGLLKKMGSRAFYGVMKAIGETQFVPQSTDFCLIDRVVLDEFNKLTEHNRITRGLLLWLGFRQTLVEFDAAPRREGEPGYSFSKLVHLALYTFVQHSLLPLRVAGYLGITITICSGIFGVVAFVNQYIFPQAIIPHMYLSGTAFLGTLCIFLAGIQLMSLGLIALYIESIHHETADRPLYVARRRINTEVLAPAHKTKNKIV